ncbi:MAG: hypothetical protein ACLSVX_01615 [Massilimicrobiota timonensis]
MLINDYKKFEEIYQKKSDVWGMTFHKSDSKNKNRRFHCPPVKGQIKKKGDYYYQFVPYGKRGQLVNSKSRGVNITHIYDNEQECIQTYNQFVQERIDELYEQIDELKSLMK